MTLLKADETLSVSIKRKYSIFAIIISMFLLDKFFVRRDGDYIIIDETVLGVGELLLLFFMGLAIIALMRPMEQKRYQKI